MTHKQLKRLFWRARIIRRLREAGRMNTEIAEMFGLHVRVIYGVQSNERYWLGTETGQRVLRYMPLDEIIEDAVRSAAAYQSKVYAAINRGAKINSRGYDLSIAADRERLSRHLRT